MEYVSTHDQIADIFTKVLPLPQHRLLRAALGIMSLSEFSSNAEAKDAATAP